MHIDWDNLGISGETSFLQLYYEPHSRTVLAHFYRSIGQGYGLKSLWGRGVEDAHYRRLTPGDSGLSFEDPVLSPVAPHVYSNVLRVEDTNGAYDGYDWDSVRRLDLAAGSSEIVIGPEGLARDPERVKSWISTIHGVSGDGREIYCSVANQMRGGGAVSPTEYYLSRLILAEGRIEHITRLTATFL